MRIRAADKGRFEKEFPMENAIIVVVLVAILGGAVAYIVRAKKRGVKCIGCPSGGSCGAKKEGSSCGGCSGCSGGGCGCGSTDSDTRESCDCHEEMK